MRNIIIDCRSSSAVAMNKSYDIALTQPQISHPQPIILTYCLIPISRDPQ